MNLTPEQVKQEREVFESWARSIGKTDRDLQREEWDGSGEYSWITEKDMFAAWQAGRALLRSAGDGWPCEVVEADFSENTITLQMKGADYTVSAGEYRLIPPPPVQGGEG